MNMRLSRKVKVSDQEDRSRYCAAGWLGRSVTQHVHDMTQASSATVTGPNEARHAGDRCLMCSK